MTITFKQWYICKGVQVFMCGGGKCGPEVSSMLIRFEKSPAHLGREKSTDSKQKLVVFFKSGI